MSASGAAFAVAETGSVCLTQSTLVVNSFGYLPQHLIVLLIRRILSSITSRLSQAEFLQGHYVVHRSSARLILRASHLMAPGVRSSPFCFTAEQDHQITDTGDQHMMKSIETKDRTALAGIAQ
jgi:hypothetical protein